MMQQDLEQIIESSMNGKDKEIKGLNPYLISDSEGSDPITRISTIGKKADDLLLITIVNAKDRPAFMTWKAYILWAESLMERYPKVKNRLVGYLDHRALLQFALAIRVSDPDARNGQGRRDVVQMFTGVFSESGSSQRRGFGPFGRNRSKEQSQQSNGNNNNDHRDEH